LKTGDRIRQLRLQRGLSQEELGALIGVKKAAIHKYENEIVVNLKHSTITQLASALETTPAYLMGWDDELQSVAGVANIIPMPKMNTVPLVGAIACGTPILAEENIEELVEVPAHIDADFALRCVGDSMINARIFDGDIVYIKKQSIVSNGQIAAVIIDGEATLKRVYYQTGVSLTLVAENPKYPPLVFTGEAMNNIVIAGLAVYFTSVIRHDLTK
jgi:repressor LexA